MLNLNTFVGIESDDPPSNPKPPRLIGPHPKVGESEPEPEQPASNIDVLAPPSKSKLSNKERHQRNNAIREWENIMNWEGMTSETIKNNIKKARDLF